MLKRRLMAFILAASMVVGNASPALAAESSAPISVDGGTVTTNEDGSVQITSNSQTSSGSTESDESAGQAGSSGDTSGSEAGEVTTETGGTSSLDGADGEGAGTSPDASADGSEGSASDTGTSIDGSLDTGEENAEGTDEDAPLDVPEKAEEDMDTEEDSVSENEVEVSTEAMVGRNYLSGTSEGPITVSYLGESSTTSEETKHYKTLEEAVKQLQEDFSGKTGAYRFTFRDTVELTENVTLPACVTYAYFGTEQKKDEEKFAVRNLNLNGKTLTIPHELFLDGGLRLVSKEGNGNAEDTATAGKLSVKTRLYIDESVALANVDGGGSDWEDLENSSRPTILDNVDISASTAEVVLRAEDKKGEETHSRTIDGVINAKDLIVQEGSWTTGEITVANLSVYGVNQNTLEGEAGQQATTYWSDQAQLHTSKVTVTNGHAEINGILGSRLGESNQEGTDNSLNLNALVIILNKSRLFLGQNRAASGTDGAQEITYGQVYATNIIVSSAYPQESMNDWTIENCGLLYANVIDMKAGTFYNNSGRVIADKVNAVNLENGYNASFIVNTLAQMTAGKTWLHDGSRLLINKTGVLNNITLGDRDGNGGTPYLGRSATGNEGQAASLTLGGTFIVNDEEQKLYFIVTDAYKALKDLKDEGGTEISISENIKTLNKDEVVFTISNEKTVFPVEYITVLSEKAESSESNPLSAVYQSGKEIRLTSEYIRLFATATVEDENGDNEILIRSFTSWKECITYLTQIGNTNTTYTIHLNTTEEVNVGGALTLPKNVGKLKIYGGIEGQKVKLVSGNITLNTDTEFSNIEFVNEAVLNTGGKELIFQNSAGTFTQITGTATSTVNVWGSEITTTKPMTGIGQVKVDSGKLTVNGNFTVQTLDLVGGTLEVKGEKSVVTVGKELILWHMEGQTGDTGTNDISTRKNPSINAEGTIKLANITTYTDGASLKYNNTKAPGLTITGSITSMKTDKSGQELADVYVVENSDGSHQAPYKIQTDKPESGDYQTIKKNSFSLNLEEGLGEGTVLVNAPKMASAWFVINKKLEEDQTSGESVSTLVQTTYKDGALIKSAGSIETVNVVLMQIESGNTNILAADEGQIDEFKNKAVYLGGFDSLQAAFSEIDRLNKIENEYYISVNDAGSNAAADLVFPSKAEYVLIVGEADETELNYKANIAVKTNTYFENLVLSPAAASTTLNLGNFEVVLSNTKFAAGESGSEKKVTVTGGGLTKGSLLKLHNLGQGAAVEMTFVAVSNVGTLWQSGINVTVTGTAAVNTLRMEDSSADNFETFTGLGTISVKNIVTTGGNTIKTLPGYTLNRDKTIKAIAPKLTITGTVEIVDYVDSGDVLEVELLKDTSGKETWNLGAGSKDNARIETLLETSGLPLAKAVNADSSYVSFSGGNGGDVYKKNGVLIYRDRAPFAYLEYNVVQGDNSTKVTTYCETFSDAVKEINNLKTKRAYTIIFQGVNLEDIVPETLTMPNKNYISHLTLAAEGGAEVYYRGNITFTSDVLLDNINFVQVVAVNGEYKPAEEAAAEGLPVPVTVNTGGFSLEFAQGAEDGGVTTPNTVSFNTPVLFNGGGKGTLTLHNSVELLAGDLASNDGEYREHGEDSMSLIRGRITNFAEVNIDQTADLLGWFTYNTQKKTEVYNAAELNVTTLTISQNVYLEVGNDYYTDKVTVKNLTLAGGKLYVTGSGVFTNVTLANDEPVLSVTAPEPVLDDEGNPPSLPVCTFTIGTLSNTAYGAILETGLNAKAESALNISGPVVMAGSYLEEEGEKITVKVYIPLDGVDTVLGESFELGKTKIVVTERGKEVEKTISSTLLTAKNADERAFLADYSCVGDAQPYSSDPENGYVLKKNGAAISVYYSEQIGAALYIEKGEEAESFYNYYPTLPDAITAIETLKNTEVSTGIKGVNAEYRIEVLQDAYQLNAKGEIVPFKLSMPKSAAHVTIMSDVTGTKADTVPAKQLFITGDIVLGCNTTFESVEFMNANNFLTKGKDLNLINIEQYHYPELKDENAGITNQYADANRKTEGDAVTVTFGRIDGGKTGNVRIASTGRNHQFSGGLFNTNSLALEHADVLIPASGKLTANVLSLTDGDIWIVSGTAAVKDVYNLGTKENKISYGRNASNKQPNLTISGDIYHGETANALVLELNETPKLTAQMGAANGSTYTLNPVSELINLDKAAMDKLSFKVKNGTEAKEITEVAWANKGVYWIPDALKEKKITVSWEAAKKDEKDLSPDAAEEEVYTVVCLDIAQASVYISNRADKTESYKISFNSDIEDTVVTDKAAISVLTLPAKDKADSIILDGQADSSDTPSTVYFTGNITANGAVEFKNIKLANQADFSITNVKNSDIVQNRTLVEPGAAELIFTNVDYAESKEGKAYGKILNIIGTKGWTNVSISGKALELVGGLTNVNGLTVEAMLTTGGKSEVNTFKLLNGGAWKALGATLITDVEVSATEGVSDVANFIATTYSVDKDKNSIGLPLLTIKGEVNKEKGTGGIPVKVIDPKTGKELGVSETDSSQQGQSDLKEAYNSVKLLVAVKESADKFIASPYVKYEETAGYGFSSDLSGQYQAFKDGKNYVSNGNIGDMEVKLITNGTDETYVKTYAEAIQIINNIGNGSAEYTLELQKTGESTGQSEAGGEEAESGNQGIILTGVDKEGNPVEGVLTMPKAGKASSLTIAGETEDIQLKFTGKITPTCNLIFDNLTMTEVSLNRTSKQYEDLYYVDLNIGGNYTVTFGNDVAETKNGVGSRDVKTLSASEEAKEIQNDNFFKLENQADYDLVFKSIAGAKGSVEFVDGTGNNVYSMGDVNVGSLCHGADGILAAGGKVTIGEWYSTDGAGEVGLKSKKAISITKISMNGSDCEIHTCYMQKAWGSAVSQLTIADNISTVGKVNINLYAYDMDTKAYKVISEEQLKTLLITAEEKPAAWKKLFTAPKMSLLINDTSVPTEGEITVAGAENYNLTKYEGGVYLTEEENTIEVKGTESGLDGKQEIEIYEGMFLSWEQAIKDIDRQRAGLDYTITIHNDQDEYAPIKVVTMPSKAKSLTVKGEKETDGNSITGLVTTTGAITLKCDTIFENIHLAAVKKSGNGYYTAPMTLNAGNYRLELVDIPDGNYYQGLDYFESRLILTGTAKGSAEIKPLYEGDVHGNGILQISKLGGVTLNYAEKIEAVEATDGNPEAEEGRTIQKTYYRIKEGISGVGSLRIEEGVYVDCDKKEVSVKDLSIGTALPIVKSGESISYPHNPKQSSLEAKNITVTGVTTMATARLKAGTTVVGDGKITLTDVVFKDMHNFIEGKQDKSGNSLITIKRTVKAEGENIVPSWSAATLSLTLNNSAVRLANLATGMTFLTAPRVESSWFIPNYEYGSDVNMGPAIRTMIELVTGTGSNDKQPLYGLYKAGNLIKYGHLFEEISTAETQVELLDLAEVQVWSGSAGADDTYEKHPYTTYLTFEEAVNGINSMALQKEVMVNGKATKANEDYTIEVLRDIEIGNAKGDGRYSVLTLPTKVGELTVFGYGSSIRFSGNIAVRSNTTLESGITLTPMKAVKGGAEPTTTNIAVGNFKLTFAGADVGYWNEDSKPVSLLNNLTGGAKGELIIAPGSGIEAVNVTGLNKVVFKGNGSSKTDASQSQGEKQIVEILEVAGKINVKSILAKDYAVATLMNGQGLTANVIGQDKNSELTIHNPAEVPMRLNGGKLSEVGSSTTETGSAYSGSGSPINLKMVSSSGTVLDGTKMITGKYLKKSDWKVDVLAAEWDTETARNIYANGNDLYLGSEYIQ